MWTPGRSLLQAFFDVVGCWPSAVLLLGQCHWSVARPWSTAWDTSTQGCAGPLSLWTGFRARSCWQLLVHPAGRVTPDSLHPWLAGVQRCVEMGGHREFPSPELKAGSIHAHEVTPVVNLLCIATAVPHSKSSGAISFCPFFVGLRYHCPLFKQSGSRLLDDNLLLSHNFRSWHSGKGHNRKLTSPSKLLLLPGATIALSLWGHCFAQ